MIIVRTCAESTINSKGSWWSLCKVGFVQVLYRWNDYAKESKKKTCHMFLLHSLFYELWKLGLPFVA